MDDSLAEQISGKLIDKAGRSWLNLAYFILFNLDFHVGFSWTSNFVGFMFDIN